MPTVVGLEVVEASTGKRYKDIHVERLFMLFYEKFYRITLGSSFLDCR